MNSNMLGCHGSGYWMASLQYFRLGRTVMRLAYYCKASSEVSFWKFHADLPQRSLSPCFLTLENIDLSCGKDLYKCKGINHVHCDNILLQRCMHYYRQSVHALLCLAPVVVTFTSASESVCLSASPMRYSCGLHSCQIKSTVSSATLIYC